MGDTVDLSQWIVVKTIGGSFLGKIDQSRHTTENLLQVFGEGRTICLKPCFDFFAPIRPTNTSGTLSVQRDPIVIPFDFTTQDVPVHLKAQSLMLCGDLEGGDATLYKNLIEQALRMQLRARAQAAGILLGDPRA